MHRKVALPLVLYPRSPYLHLAQYDCDCACALDLPTVLSGPSAVGSYDCDCACALDLPTMLSVPSDTGSYDCDCACALDLLQGSSGRPAATVWTRQRQAVPMPLEGGWQAYFNPAGPVGISVLNTEAQRVLAAFDAPISPDAAARHLPGMPAAVLRETIEGLGQVGLVRPMAVSSVSPAQPSTLSAWLHVTEACSLDCPYCYVHKHAKAMSPEVGRQAIDRLAEVASRHGYRSLKLKYAGGEPTLNFPLIRILHARAARRAAEAGLALEEVILSNGVGIMDAMLDAVAQAGMRLMVSLDGDQATHDRVRARRDGGGTYAAVVWAVEGAIERGLQPNISITLTALNLEAAPAAVAFALERELPFNLNFYRECAMADSAGIPSLLVPNPAQLVDTMLRIFDLIRTYPTYPLSLTGILDRTRLDAPHQHPCSAGRDYMVVDTEGRASACQMLLEEPWASLADEDPLDTIRQHGERIFRPVDRQSDCYACPWRTACSGGCPLMRGTALHDWYCQVYRILLPELVRLEAGRLIASLAQDTHVQGSPAQV
jgi:uncharacterized protein